MIRDHHTIVSMKPHGLSLCFKLLRLIIPMKFQGGRHMPGQAPPRVGGLDAEGLPDSPVRPQASCMRSSPIGAAVSSVFRTGLMWRLRPPPAILSR